MSVQMVESILRGMEEIELAQEQFARAMMQYAEQLKSHTSAIEGLSKASQELSKSATEQNKFLIHLTKFVEQPPSEVPHIINEPEEEIEVINIASHPPGCYKRRLLQNKDDQLISIR